LNEDKTINEPSLVSLSFYLSSPKTEAFTGAQAKLQHPLAWQA